MKKKVFKIGIWLLALLLLNANGANAQEIWMAQEQSPKDAPVAVGLEINYQLTDVDLGNKLGCTVGLSATFCGIYLAYTSNFDNLMNSSSYLSNNDLHLNQNISSFSLGFAIPLAQTPNTDMGVTPLVSFQRIAYNIESGDVSSVDLVTKKKVGIGAAITFRGNEFMGYFKIASTEIGAGMSFVIPIWDYLNY
jgi:hypothetical protein